MSAKFDLFYKTLQEQGIQYQDNKLVPEQFYAAHYEEFYSQIQSYAQRNKIHKFLVLTDDLNITNIFPKNLDIKFINTSEIFDVNLSEYDGMHFISIPISVEVTTAPIAKNIHATFWIEPLLKAAPISLARASFGYLLAYFVACGDCYLGFKLNMLDTYYDTAFQLMKPFFPFLQFKDENVSATNYLLNNMEILVQAQVMAQVSTSLCNQTTLLNGYEHAISRGLHFLRLSSHKDLVLHGEQIALGTISSSISYEWLLAQNEFDTKKLRSLTEKEASSLIQKLLSKAPFIDAGQDVHKSFLNDYLIKNERWNKVKENFDTFCLEWPDIKNQLQQLVLSPIEIEKILTK
ncbi:MAG: hypothetical protein V4591_03485, partial [Bdellovibrionota bacterium]